MKIRIKTNNILGIGLILASFLISYFLNYLGLLAGIAILLLPFLVAYTILAFNVPRMNAYILLLYSFFSVFFSRYLLKDTIPAGTIFDALLVYGYAIVLVKGITEKINWAKILDAPIIILFIYFFNIFLSFVNPEFLGIDVWLLGFRVHMYLVLSIPLFCLLLDVKSLKTMLILWGICSMIMSVKAFSQLNIRLDSADQAFLVGNSFHMVNGKLRAFAYLSDAGQFGAQQAHAATIGAFMFLIAKNKKQRWFFTLMTIAGMYGMFVSGTRGAIFVLFGAALFYCFIIRRFKLMIISSICAGGFFCFMYFTSIGNNNYDIYRMRTAFKPEQDASYMVRKLNQAILKDYLKSRPFGGGIGAMQYGPSGTVLKDIPYDSGFVLLWGDMGIAGLSLYISLIILFLIKGTLVVWYKIKNEWLRNIVIAMMSGIVGISVANYGNPVMLQFPTCVLYFLSVAIIYAAPRIDKSLQAEDEQVVKQQPATTQLIKSR